MSIELDIDTIEKATSRLLSKIKEQGNLTVTIDRDLYWDMCCKHRYKTHGVGSDQAAKHLIKSSLSDALGKVKEKDTVDALIYIAPLLMAIGEEFLKLADPTCCP